jgi:hypothetical protein
MLRNGQKMKYGIEKPHVEEWKRMFFVSRVYALITDYNWRAITTIPGSRQVAESVN